MYELRLSFKISGLNLENDSLLTSAS